MVGWGGRWSTDPVVQVRAHMGARGRVTLNPELHADVCAPLAPIFRRT